MAVKKILERTKIKGTPVWKMTDQWGKDYLFTDTEMLRARVRAMRIL